MYIYPVSVSCILYLFYIYPVRISLVSSLCFTRMLNVMVRRHSPSVLLPHTPFHHGSHGAGGRDRPIISIFIITCCFLHCNASSLSQIAFGPCHCIRTFIILVNTLSVQYFWVKFLTKMNSSRSLNKNLHWFLISKMFLCDELLHLPPLPVIKMKNIKENIIIGDFFKNPCIKLSHLFHNDLIQTPINFCKQATRIMKTAQNLYISLRHLNRFYQS
jgi:hypothetical protein